MKFLSYQKGIIAIIVVLVIAAVVFAQEKTQQVPKSNVTDEYAAPSENKQDSTSEIQIYNEDKKDSVSTDPIVASHLVLKGTFIIVYGDPLDGGTARYYYSVTDSQGKTTKLIFTNNSKYIDGESLINYDRKQVKISGKATQDMNAVEVLTIELG